MTAPTPDLIDRLGEAATEVRDLLRQCHEARRDLKTERRELDERWARMKTDTDERTAVLKQITDELLDQFERERNEVWPSVKARLDRLTDVANEEYCAVLNQYGEKAEALVDALEEVLRNQEETVLVVRVSELPDDLREKLLRHMRSAKLGQPLRRTQ